jgi:hypothetical protein
MTIQQDERMRQKDFEATYREMQVERLLGLTMEIADLVPEARAALLAELHRRGKSQSDIERFAAELKGELPDMSVERGTAGDAGMEAGNGDAVTPGEEQPSVMLEGPAPADWVRIPRFGIQEAVGLAACMEECRIPFQIEPAPGFERQQHLLAVSRERFKDCLAALKEYYGLLDEPPEAFTGDCPACGTHVSGAATCPDCGLALCVDGWQSYGSHPFAQFLTENGLGRRKADAG